MEGVLNRCANCDTINVNKHSHTLCRGCQLFREEEHGFRVRHNEHGVPSVTNTVDYDPYITMRRQTSLLWSQLQRQLLQQTNQ